MKVLVLKGSNKKGAEKAELSPLAQVWVEDKTVYVSSTVPGVRQALEASIADRLRKGPIFRAYAKYYGPEDAPHTIVDARAPLKISDSEVLGWWKDEEWFWETKVFAGYHVDAFYSEVVEENMPAEDAGKPPTVTIRGYRQDDTQWVDELTLGEVRVDNSQLQISCRNRKLRKALTAALSERLQQGPVFRRYLTYTPPTKKQPYKSTDHQESIDIQHPGFLKWLLSDYDYWKGRVIAGYVLEGSPHRREYP